jgi:hypothetical protein
MILLTRVDYRLLKKVNTYKNMMLVKYHINIILIVKVYFRVTVVIYIDIIYKNNYFTVVSLLLNDVILTA